MNSAGSELFIKLVSSPCIIPFPVVGIGVQVGDRFKLGALTPSGSEAPHLLLLTLNPNSRKVIKDRISQDRVINMMEQVYAKDNLSICRH